MSKVNVAPSKAPNTIVNVIEPPKSRIPLNLDELWNYRDLVVFLTLRDLKVRYQQTVLGVLWAIIQPFVTMIVFSFVFGRIARLPSDGIPYPLFSYVGLLPWNFFSDGLTKGASSLTANASMIRKIYFPRLILPITSILSGLVDFLLAASMLAVLYLYYVLWATPVPAAIQTMIYPVANTDLTNAAFAHATVPFQVTGNVIWLPLLMLLAFCVALAMSLWLSAMNVRFRDVGYGLGFVIRILMYLTPVAYPISRLDSSLRGIASLNPMTGVVEGFRWALLGVDSAPGPYIFVSAVMTLLLLVGGLYYFRHTESQFADLL
jgi:lipopolysaccharide transport system permease protein